MRRLLLLGCGALLLSAGSAAAHHSGSMFDKTKTVELKGTVKSFQWTNPHTWTYMLVPNEQGGVDEWGIEGGSPNILTRVNARWNRNTIKAGDQITMTIHPVKDGRKMGVMDTITHADGTTIKGAGL